MMKTISTWKSILKASKQCSMRQENPKKGKRTQAMTIHSITSRAKNSSNWWLRMKYAKAKSTILSQGNSVEKSTICSKACKLILTLEIQIQTRSAVPKASPWTNIWASKFPSCSTLMNWTWVSRIKLSEPPTKMSSITSPEATTAKIPRNCYRKWTLGSNSSILTRSRRVPRYSPISRSLARAVCEIFLSAENGMGGNSLIWTASMKVILLFIFIE